MSRILQPILGCYLVLCLALAGAVGTSPLLHQWLEHGGQGQAHVHHGGPSGGHYHHDESQPHTHPHPHPTPAPQNSLKDRLVHHGGAFGLPNLQGLCRMVGLFLPLRSVPDSEPGSGHEHHSLPQLMAAGLAEHVEPPSLTAFFFLGHYQRVMNEDSSSKTSPWNAQACPRGPPSICV